MIEAEALEDEAESPEPNHSSRRDSNTRVAKSVLRSAGRVQPVTTVSVDVRADDLRLMRTVQPSVEDLAARPLGLEKLLPELAHREFPWSEISRSKGSRDGQAPCALSIAPAIP